METGRKKKETPVCLHNMTSLEEIKSRLARTTAGEWEVEDYRHNGSWRSTGCIWARNTGTHIADVNFKSLSSISDPALIAEFEGNAEFIAHSPRDIERLVAAYEILRDALVKVRFGGPDSELRQMVNDCFDRSIQAVEKADAILEGVMPSGQSR